VIVIAADRAAVAAFAEAVHCNAPLPVPEPPAVTVNHDWLLTAVHASAPSVVVREIEPVPPEAPAFADGGLTTNTPPDCVTVRVTVGAPADTTVSVAVRGAADGLEPAL
jgi:hypothetical protein